LLDILVFGKQAGRRAAAYAVEAEYKRFPTNATENVRQDFDRVLNCDGGENAADIASQMKKVMMEHVGVFRTEEGMSKALDTVRALKERYQQVCVRDKGKAFNTDLLNTWELGCLLDAAEITAASALARQESRGAHAREDFPKRDDKKWLRHTLAWLKEDQVELRYKDVKITKYQPEERVY
jgi:succinate dehydrogenase / fumarate reductase flavoprotein subunit